VVSILRLCNCSCTKGGALNVLGASKHGNRAISQGCKSINQKLKNTDIRDATTLSRDPCHRADGSCLKVIYCGAKTPGKLVHRPVACIEPVHTEVAVQSITSHVTDICKQVQSISIQRLDWMAGMMSRSTQTWERQLKSGVISWPKRGAPWSYSSYKTAGAQIKCSR
jgi:hypothetical protein